MELVGLLVLWHLCRGIIKPYRPCSDVSCYLRHKVTKNFWNGNQICRETYLIHLEVISPSNQHETTLIQNLNNKSPDRHVTSTQQPGYIRLNRGLLRRNVIDYIEGNSTLKMVHLSDLTILWLSHCRYLKGVSLCLSHRYKTILESTKKGWLCCKLIRLHMGCLFYISQSFLYRLSQH